jgi:hypothetical protein
MLLSLFPMEYWIILAIASLGRFFSGQLISYRLSKLNTDSRYKLLVKTVTSKQFVLFMRFSGMAHVVLVLGLVVMFYMTYQFMIPVNENSITVLHIVKYLGYMLLLSELVNSVLSIALTIFLIRKRS